MDETAKRVTALASTASVDRDEEVILPDGWMLDTFKRNPVFLYGHAHRSNDPQDLLGKVVSIEVVPAGLLATFEYDTDINPKAAMVFEQVKKGTQRAFSVGFLPKSWVTSYSPKDHLEALPEAARKALEEGRAFVVYTATELIEISQVKIGSNPDALTGAGLKAARLQELKSLEEPAVNDKTPAPAPEPDKAAPDLGAIVKAAVAEAVAPLVEALGKLAAPAPVEKAETAEDQLVKQLAALPDDQLQAVLSDLEPAERKHLLELISV